MAIKDMNIMPEGPDNYEKIEDYFVSLNSGRIYPLAMETIEKRLIEKALEESSGNQIAAAKLLGIHRNTLHMKIQKLHIDLEKYKV